MVDHQILRIVLRLGERVVAGAILAVFGAGLEHRHRTLGPGILAQQVAAALGRQEAHGIRHAGSGGGIRDVDLVLVEQEGRAFVDEEVDALPVVFRLGEHDRIAFQRPRVGHLGDIQIGIAFDRRVLLSPHEVLHAVDHLGSGVEREGVDRSDDLALLHPVVGSGVVIGVLQHEHAMRRQSGGLEIRCGACEVDIPSAVDAVQFRSPDVDARRAGFMLAPHHSLRSLLQVVDIRCVTNGDAVVFRVGASEVVLAVNFKDPRICALKHDRIVVNSHF